MAWISWLWSLEVSMTGDDVKWWVNSPATKYVARDRNMFKSYDVINQS